MAELREAVTALTAKARRLLAMDGLVGEENTKAVLVEPMLQALGWDTHDLDEVQREFRYKSQDNPVDYALLVSAKPRLFVEAKSLGRDLGQHKWRIQAVNYANTSGVEWCVLTDGNFWQVYKSNAPGDLDQKLFLETWLYSADGRTPPYGPGYVLSLLARDKLAEKQIEMLWQALNVDRRGREALLALIETPDPSLVRLLCKRAALTRGQAEAFLGRAEVAVETPPVTVEPSQPSQPGRSAPVAESALGVLGLKSKRVSATGRLTADGFMVLARSQAVLQEAPHLKGASVQLRAQLLAQGLLVQVGDHLEFTQDHAFRSPSLAASVVLGRAANGWIEWKDEQGRYLRDLRQSPSARADTAPVRGLGHSSAPEPKPPQARYQRRDLPSQQSLELPLLRAIIARGGEIVMKERKVVERSLADEFGLTEEQRTAVLSDGKATAWGHRVGWTRWRLLQSGDLDGTQRGVWRVTDQGRRRAGGLAGD